MKASGIVEFLKKEAMLTVSLLAAVISLFITPPSPALLSAVDWRTLGTLLMMLCVLEGFKQENIFRPLIMLSARFSTMLTLSLFLIFGVFFTSMFVTNDVSLIIFVPLTILLFRGGDKEKYILPVISMENIAAIRGSLLMPFGSPQNLFIYSQSGIDTLNFIRHMSPLCIMSGILLVIFVTVLYRKDLKEEIVIDKKRTAGEWKPEGKVRRVSYILLFILVLGTIVSRTDYWWVSLAVVLLVIAAVNIRLFVKVDYVLIITFFCFFIFSSSVAANPGISSVLTKSVAGNEFWLAIGLSQLISNVPATIVLYPFTESVSGLIYGADTAGLCSIIGSLASVINYRIYVREYPGKGGKFLKVFTFISWAFFVIVVIPCYLLSKWMGPWK